MRTVSALRNAQSSSAMTKVSSWIHRLYQPLTRSMNSVNHASILRCARPRSPPQFCSSARRVFLTSPSGRDLTPVSRSVKAIAPCLPAVAKSMTAVAKVAGER